MSNVIGFLERMGQDSQMRHATREATELSLVRAEVEPALRAALLEGDQVGLEELLGARTNVVCLIAPSKEDDDGESDDRPMPDDDEIYQSRSVAR